MPRPAFFLFALITMPLLVGCDGCQVATPQSQNPEDAENAPKEAYSTESAAAYPTDINDAASFVKPGHWATIEQPIRSNKADTRGDLISRASVTLRNTNAEVTGSIESIENIRPVTMSKGQMKRFDYRLRIPLPKSSQESNVIISSKFVPRSGGVMDTGGQRFNILRGSEYFFVVLTSRPERFSRLQVADWVRSTEDRIADPIGARNYRVVIPDSDGLMTMPETMLDMTSIAVVLWDDLDANALTPLQFTALADWIRYGGRLIVNGPDASDSIANTALSDLLPLYPTSNIELSPDAAIELLKKNSVPSDRSLDSQIEKLRSTVSHIAVDGQLDPSATPIDGTASLVLRRRIGRGQVVQPRFDVTGSWIETWDSYDSFVNGVLLNRPARKYLPPIDSGYSESEASAVGYNATDLRQVFVGTDMRSDAAVNTHFRISTRDDLLSDSEDGQGRTYSPFDSMTYIDSIAGVSGWNDSSDSIKLLRETLTGEAGIEIPQSSLVVRSLAIYLIVLVPINYIVFRLMNRLEYAWFAVPVIAILGAIFAARQARLDIGFARSNTELAVLEVQPDYRRAHLTRLVGIYNSLSSRYELQFSTPDGIAVPLDDESDPNTSVAPHIKTSFEEGPSLADFAVNSNRMRYVHTEEMVDMGGSITLAADETISNTAAMELLDAIIVRQADDGSKQIAVLGSLRPGESKAAEFRSTDRILLSEDLPMQTSRIIRKLASARSFPNGSTRLIARVDGSLDGLSITPKASQHVAQTIVLAHLDHPALPIPKIDQNLIGDFRRVNRVDQTTKTESDQQDTNE